MSGHLDSSDLDDRPIDFDRLERNYMDSMNQRNIVVARLLGEQFPDNAIVQAENVTVNTPDGAGRGPSGLCGSVGSTG